MGLQLAYGDFYQHKHFAEVLLLPEHQNMRVLTSTGAPRILMCTS